MIALYIVLAGVSIYLMLLLVAVETAGNTAAIGRLARDMMCVHLQTEV